MSRIYKKTNFAGSDSLTGIAFGGGGGGGGGGNNEARRHVQAQREKNFARVGEDQPNNEPESDNKTFADILREGVSDYVKKLDDNIVKGGYEELTGTSAGADSLSEAFFEGSDTAQRFDNDVDKLFGTGEYAK